MGFFFPETRFIIFFSSSKIESSLYQSFTLKNQFSVVDIRQSICVPCERLLRQQGGEQIGKRWKWKNMLLHARSHGCAAGESWLRGPLGAACEVLLCQLPGKAPGGCPLPPTHSALSHTSHTALLMQARLRAAPKPISERAVCAGPVPSTFPSLGFSQELAYGKPGFLSPCFPYSLKPGIKWVS